MKINYKAGRINVELEGDTQKDLFSQLSSFQEVFDEDTCGKCGGRLEFGQVKKGGGLFPRRKDKEGSWLPDNGWVKWNPKTKTVE